MRDPRNVAIFTLSVACAFLAGALLGRPGAAEAQQAPTTYGGNAVSQNNRMIAATGTVGSGMSVLWLVDTEAKRVIVYGTNNLGKNVELRAARNIEWDLRLDEYHDDSQYKAADLEKLADKRRSGAVKEGTGEKAEEEPK